MFNDSTPRRALHEVLQRGASEEKMANKPKNKFGKGQISLAVFEPTQEGAGNKDFYSLQRSRKVGEEWKNENILLSQEQLKDVKELIEQALGEGA